MTSSAKRRMRARVSYDGTNYKGWQFQNGQPTIQATLEESMSRKFGEHVRVVGASRTDTGVHARGQGFHFDVPPARVPKDALEMHKLEFSLNQLLPADIRIRHVGIAPFATFQAKEPLAGLDGTVHHLGERPWHAIYSSSGKLYSYRFTVGSVVDPLQRLYRHHEWRASRYGFSEDLLRQATARFVGAHDFSAFTNTTVVPIGHTPPVLKNPVRTVHSAHVIDEGDGCYKIEFKIDGAMYRMIRNIVGTILDVACGKMEMSTIESIFESRDRRRVPKSAPARGLCLEEVFYENWSS